MARKLQQTERPLEHALGSQCGVPHSHNYCCMPVLFILFHHIDYQFVKELRLLSIIDLELNTKDKENESLNTQLCKLMLSSNTKIL